MCGRSTVTFITCPSHPLFLSWFVMFKEVVMLYLGIITKTCHSDFCAELSGGQLTVVERIC